MKKNTLDIILLFLILLVIFSGGFYVLSKQSKNQNRPENQLLVITNSGSTNFSGYSIVVNTDGSGTLQYAGGQFNPKDKSAKSFSRGTFNSAKLQNTLSQIGDVSKIPVGRCMKSVSFGSVTKITYNGKTSQDISCPAEDAVKMYQDLYNEVSQIERQALK